MNKNIIFILILYLFSGLTYSQDSGNRWGSGVLVSVGGLDNLGPQNYEGGIGAIFHLKKFALRPTFSINSESQEDNDAGTKESTFGFGLGCDVLKFLSNKRVNPYYGGGLKFGSEKTKFENGFTTETSVTDFSLRGIAGVEIVLFKNIVLSFEYHLTYISSSTDVKNGLAKSVYATSGIHEGKKSEVEIGPGEAFITFVLCSWGFIL